MAPDWQPAAGTAMIVGRNLYRWPRAAVFSLECGMPDLPLGTQQLRLIVTAFLARTRMYELSIPASQIPASYQRFALTLTLDNDPIPPGAFVRVEIRNEVSSGPAAAMFWTRPTLSSGAALAPWTAELPRLARLWSVYLPPPS